MAQELQELFLKILSMFFNENFNMF